jgi:hypothetical protein
LRCRILADKQRDGIFGTADKTIQCLKSRNTVRWSPRQASRRRPVTRDACRQFHQHAFAASQWTICVVSKERACSAASLTTALTVAIAEAMEERAERSGALARQGSSMANGKSVNPLVIRARAALISWGRKCCASADQWLGGLRHRGSSREDLYDQRAGPRQYGRDRPAARACRWHGCPSPVRPRLCPAARCQEEALAVGRTNRLGDAFQVKPHRLCRAIRVVAADRIDDREVLRKRNAGASRLSCQLELEAHCLAA